MSTVNEHEFSTGMPALAVVLIAPYEFEQIMTTLDCISRQDISYMIEIIIITESAGMNPDIKELLRTFHSFKLIKIDKIVNVGQCLSMGFLKARAKIVTYCEEHSYPQNGWARQLVELHESEYSAVGWCLVNFNPESIISIANFYTSFGPWIAPVMSGRRKLLASHHVSYKVEVLKRYSDKLDKLLEQETVFLNFLHKRGHTFYLTSEAKSMHINIDKIGTYLYSEYVGGRLFAANRSEFGEWNPFRRFIYVVGSPLRPFSRILRVINSLNRTGGIINYLPKMLPILLVSVITHSFAEVIGYLFGPGNSYIQNKSIELFRNRRI